MERIMQKNILKAVHPRGDNLESAFRKDYSQGNGILMKMLKHMWKLLGLPPKLIHWLLTMVVKSKKEQSGQCEFKRPREKISFHFVVLEWIFSFSIALSCIAQTIFSSSIHPMITYGKIAQWQKAQEARVTEKLSSLQMTVSLAIPPRHWRCKLLWIYHLCALLWRWRPD